MTTAFGKSPTGNKPSDEEAETSSNRSSEDDSENESIQEEQSSRSISRPRPTFMKESDNMTAGSTRPREGPEIIEVSDGEAHPTGSDSRGSSARCLWRSRNRLDVAGFLAFNAIQLNSQPMLRPAGGIHTNRQTRQAYGFSCCSSRSSPHML